jgi:hypothetical protein
VICRHIRRLHSAPTTATELTDEDKALVRNMIIEEHAPHSAAGGISETDHRLRQVG